MPLQLREHLFPYFEEASVTVPPPQDAVFAILAWLPLALRSWIRLGLDSQSIFGAPPSHILMYHIVDTDSDSVSINLE